MPTSSRSKGLIFRSLIVWGLIMAAETLHGIARSVLLEPYIGDLSARRIGVATGSLIILAIAFAFVRWIGARTRWQLLAVGLLWLGLTLIFEIVLGRFVIGYSWERLLSDYNVAEGGFLAFGMLFLALSPLIAARIRRIGVA